MLKSVKVNLVLFLTVVCASIGGMQAQIQAPVQNATDISEQELSNFADAYQAIQSENQKAQQEMMSMIQKNGLEVERFQEIQKAQSDPNTKLDATEEELASHKVIMTELQKMQPQLQTRMEGVIKDNGLTMERYQQVAAAIQSDSDLQQKFQAIMMKMQTKS